VIAQIQAGRLDDGGVLAEEQIDPGAGVELVGRHRLLQHHLGRVELGLVMEPVVEPAYDLVPASVPGGVGVGRVTNPLTADRDLAGAAGAESAAAFAVAESVACAATAAAWAVVAVKTSMNSHIRRMLSSDLAGSARPHTPGREGTFRSIAGGIRGRAR